MGDLKVMNKERYFDQTGGYLNSYQAVVNREPTPQEMRDLQATQNIVCVAVSNVNPNNVQFQALLNHYQYDRKGYLNAAVSAGLDWRDAALFADEVKGRLAAGNYGSGNGREWIDGFLLLGVPAVLILILYKAIMWLF